jgi:hypothetical protein
MAPRKRKLFGAEPSSRPLFHKKKRHTRPKTFTGPGAAGRAIQYAQRKNKTSKTYRYKASPVSTGMFEKAYVVTSKRK